MEKHERSVSTGDHSFTAHDDGKYTYCFSNEHWSATSKEVSFNVHGIVYVPEADIPSDPLEAEGELTRFYLYMHKYWFTSSTPIDWTSISSQGWAVLYRPPRAHTSKYSRKHKRQSQVVEHISDVGPDRWRRLPGLVAKTLLWGRQEQCRALWGSQPVNWLTLIGQTSCLKGHLGGNWASVYQNVLIGVI